MLVMMMLLDNISVIRAFSLLLAFGPVLVGLMRSQRIFPTAFGARSFMRD